MKAPNILIIIFFLISLLLGSTASQAQQLDNKLVSLYVLNFTKYIEWPASGHNEFVIGVVGNTTAFTELSKMANGRKTAGKSIVVKQIQAADATDAKSYQILLIAESESNRLKAICDALKGSPVLVITEKMGLARKGAAISMFLDDDDDYKTKFELNKGVLDNIGLKVAAELITMSVQVKN